MSSLSSRNQKVIRIKSVDSDFEREPLLRPFGFKGKYMSEIWLVGALLESDSGFREIGLSTQSVLWSDPTVFALNSESVGNSFMYAMTKYALQLIKEKPFHNPMQLLEDIFEDIYEYGKKITQNHRLRKTFALNSLVALDNAAWLIYASENGFTSFDRMIPKDYRVGLSYRHKEVAASL